MHGHSQDRQWGGAEMVSILDFQIQSPPPLSAFLVSNSEYDYRVWLFMVNDMGSLESIDDVP